VIDRAAWAERQLQYRFTDISLLEQALTHRSASKNNNERLEFLGDALLSFSIAHELYRLLPDSPEGDLSRARAALVNGTTLAEIGREMNLDTQLIVGPGELRSGGAQRGSLLANAIEALIGAIFLDGGRDAAEALIQLLFASRVETLPEPEELKDSKTKLQEWLQGRGYGLPKYTIDAIQGRDHKKVFQVICEVDEKQTQSRGQGSSRRRAEQEAAAAMLSVLTGESD